MSVIVFFAFSDLDNIVQDMFFDSATKQWVLDRHLQPYRLIFYDGIKKLLILIAVSFLIALVFFRKKNIIKEYKKGILIVILSAILVPIAVGAIKKYTNMPCPKSEIKYGGLYPKTKVWEHYKKEDNIKGTNKCWPAGHASGGFALFSLFFLFKTRKNKTIAIVSALSVGWIMGMYKMLIGDHFLSHTIITMILAWLIVLVIRSLVFYERKIQTI